MEPPDEVWVARAGRRRRYANVGATAALILAALGAACLAGHVTAAFAWDGPRCTEVQGVVIGALAGIGGTLVSIAVVVAVAAIVVGTEHVWRAGSGIAVSIVALACATPFLTAGTTC